MSKAIADTGPILHLHEIGHLQAIRVFESLFIPDLVADEIRLYGLEPVHLGVTALTVAVTSVKEALWKPFVNVTGRPTIHPADAQVLALAQSQQFALPVLTDDLDVRRCLEDRGAIVVGSVGVLVRAYSKGYLTRTDLENAVEALFAQSTLHTSRAFAAYVRRLLDELLRGN